MNLGTAIIYLTFVCLGLSTVAYLAAMLNGDEKLRAIGRIAFKASAFLSTVLLIYLFALILNERYEFEYVYQYSSRDLALMYRVSALWAGQAGTFVLWLFFGMVMGLILIRRTAEAEPDVMGFYALIQLFLALFLLKDSPFAMLPTAPADGAGMNPLLQNPWMAVHPPIVFLGYAALAIPFAYVLGALVKGRYDEWVPSAMPWAVFGWLTLGAGIFVGGYWAYVTLGWGGYWGWDPVENASLIPWLTSTALIHAMLNQLSNKGLRKTSIVLALATYLLVVYGTFLTRSGILSEVSVHAFTDSGLNLYLTAVQLILLAISVGLFAWRYNHIPVESVPESKGISRQTTFVWTIVLLSVSALLVLLGTSSPLLTGLGGSAVSVNHTFYEMTNAPLAWLLAVILGMCPFIGLRPRSWGEVAGLTRIPGILALVVMAVDAVLGVREWPGILFTGAASFALVANLIALARALKGGLIRTGGYLAHVGVALMVVGIMGSSGYDSTTRLILDKGVPHEVYGYTLTYEGIRRPADGKDTLVLKIERGGAEWTGDSRMYRDPNHGWVKTPHVSRSFLQDLYIAPVDVKRTQATGGEKLTIGKGETQQLGDYAFSFLGFDLSGHDESRPDSMTVGAVLQVAGPDGTGQVIPAMVYSNNMITAQETALPGGKGTVRLESMNVEDKMVTIVVYGISQAPEPVSKETAILEVSLKPLVSVLWLGTIFAMLGGAIATWRRWTSIRNGSKPS